MPLGRFPQPYRPSWHDRPCGVDPVAWRWLSSMWKGAAVAVLAAAGFMLANWCMRP